MGGRHRARLWRCPKCGAGFVNRNQWHACATATLTDWLAGLSASGLALYDRFVELVARCGPYEIAPAKTRISFMAEVRFANITSLRDDSMIFTLALPQRQHSPRLTIVEEVPGWFSHRARVRTADELDAQIGAWIERSYQLMGMRGRLED